MLTATLYLSALQISSSIFVGGVLFQAIHHTLIYVCQVDLLVLPQPLGHPRLPQPPPRPRHGQLRKHLRVWVSLLDPCYY